MNNRILSIALIAAMSASCCAQTLTFKNKTDGTVLVAVGSRQTPPASIPFIKTTAGMNAVKPGQEKTIDKVVSNEEYPQIMFWKDGDSRTAYVYEITAKPGKRLAVQLTSEMKLSSVPFTYNTISKEDIVSQGTVNLDAKDRVTKSNAAKIR